MAQTVRWPLGFEAVAASRPGLDLDLLGACGGVFVVGPCVAGSCGARLTSDEFERLTEHDDGLAWWEVGGESVGVVEEADVGDDAGAR